MALARAGSAERVCLCASLPNSAFSGLVLVVCSLPPADGCITPRKSAVVTNQGSSRRLLPSRFPPELVVNRLPAQRCTALPSRDRFCVPLDHFPGRMAVFLEASVSSGIKWGPSLTVALGLWLSPGHYICYSSVVHGPSSVSITWELVSNARP